MTVVGRTYTEEDGTQRRVLSFWDLNGQYVLVTDGPDTMIRPYHVVARGLELDDARKAATL